MTSRVTIRPLTGADQEEFIALSRASRDLHHPWMTLPTTPADFQAYAAKWDGETAVSLLVCLRETGAIAGMVNVANIIRGRYQGGTLSYAAFAGTAGKGYLSEGMELALRHVFDDLRLHRLEINIQPGNHASLKLIERAGARREGYSPAYLFIDGAWRDHERWAITNPNPGNPHPSLPNP